MFLRALIAALLLCVGVVEAHTQRVAAIVGSVRHATTGEPVPYATVRMLAIRRAAISDRAGAFSIRLSPDERALVKGSRIVVSCVGFKTDTVTIVNHDSAIVVQLTERSFEGAEVVVRAEDPAVRIMRQVIARRKRQEVSLNSYQYRLYSKIVVNTDTLTATRSSGRGVTTVFSILESIADGFYKKPGKFTNRILQRRQTANIPPQANLVALGTNLSSYAGSVTLLGEEIESPFADNAFEVAEFTLRNDVDDSIAVIDLRSPSNLRKGFNGVLYIDTRTYAPLNVELEPNKAVNLPFDASLSYSQSFTIVDGMVMPLDLRIASSLTADILFIVQPRLDVEVETHCAGYVINPEIDDDVFDQWRVELTDRALTNDSVFWQQNAYGTLSREEEQAYTDIQRLIDNPDSLQSTVINRIFGPIARAIARLGRRPFSGFEDVVRYNRVHGLYLGIGTLFRPDTVIEIESGIGYGTADQRFYGWLRPTVFIDRQQRWSVDGSVFNILQRRDNPNVVRTSLITATSLLFGSDYGDYYYRRGGEAGVSYSWGQFVFIRNDIWQRPSSIRLFVRNEDNESAQTHDVWSLFHPAEQRLNPQIMSGTLRSIGAQLRVNYSPVRLISLTGLSLAIEHSNPSILPSAFAFTTLQAEGMLRVKPVSVWTTDLVATFGWSDGGVPPQRFGSLESSVNGLAVTGSFRGMRVKEFYGDRYATLSLTQNFGEVIPGILRIPGIASFGIEFIAFGGVGWTTFSEQTRALTQTMLPTTAQTREGLYYEVGLGINRLLLFFRLDVNARISQRDRPEFRITLSGATF
jgi:hypothetical protein